MAEYFLSNGAAPFGPFTAAKLVEMGVEPDTYVRRVDAEDWSYAANESEIADLLESGARASQVARDARAGRMHWGPYKDDGPIGPGLRKYSSILWDIPDDRWEQACYAMPASIKGHFFQRPTRCIRNVTMWGEWDVPDATVDGTWNAVVFLYPDIPIQLGHVGWGFRLADGGWCWGATEHDGMPPMVPPPFPNGGFVEHGSKAEMLRAFRDGYRKSGAGKGWRYKSMKLLYALNPQPDAAEVITRMLPTAGYNISGNNCMDHVVRVLNIYSGIPIVPIPALGGPVMWIPRFWFAMITGLEKSVQEGF